MAWLTVDKDMKVRIARKILNSDNDYWWKQLDDYHIMGIKNKAWIASRRMIRCLNKSIKTAKKNEHKYETITANYIKLYKKYEGTGYEYGKYYI